MATLLEKANQILAQKEANLLPENLKSGITCMGVEGTLIELQGEEKVIEPSIEEQVITPSEGKNGITQATVNPVTSAIDANILPENIKSGVSILGVEGNLEGPNESPSYFNDTTTYGINYILTYDNTSMINENEGYNVYCSKANRGQTSDLMNVETRVEVKISPQNDISETKDVTIKLLDKNNEELCSYNQGVTFEGQNVEKTVYIVGDDITEHLKNAWFIKVIIADVDMM